MQPAMQHVLSMRGVERIRNFKGGLHGLIKRQRPLLQTLREHLSLDVFHDEEIDVVLMTEGICSANIGMLQTGDELDLLFEPSAGLRILKADGGQNSDSDGAVLFRIGRFVDVADGIRYRVENLVGSDA